MILRTYHCPECNHRIEVTLTADEWNAPPPSCVACDAREMNQEFKPVSIGGSNRARAVALAEDIAHNDYHVADMQVSGKGIGERPTVRYKDTTAGVTQSSWGSNREILEGAVAIGRETRIRNGGSGLDVLSHLLKTGQQQDLIEVSKRRSIRVG